MNSKKTFLSALSLSLATGAIVVSAPFSASAAVTSFSDVKASSVHHDAIMNLAERGILQGFADGSFKPEQALTRSHASKVLAMSLKLDTENVKDPGFKDLKKTQWDYKYVAALANAGYISGFDDKTFRPNAPMTRAQMAKILDLSYKLEMDSVAVNPFTDVSNKAWYVNHVRKLVDNKVTKGDTLTTFLPNASVTRAQMASFVVRSENIDAAADLVAEAKAKIRAIVLETSTVEADGKKVAEAKYNSTNGTLTLTAYDLDKGVKALSGFGFFSDKLPALGVTDMRINTGKLVDVSKDSGAAKTYFQSELASLLKPSSNASTGDLAANNVQVTMYGKKNGVEFWETFNVNVNVFVGK